MLQNLDVIEQKPYMVLMIILCYRYYDTEDFPSISITIHNNIAQPHLKGFAVLFFAEQVKNTLFP